MVRLPWFLAVVLLCLLLTACSKDRAEPKRFPVSGTVTGDGKPLSDGTIHFKTVQTGAVDSIPIKEGKFEGQAEAGERRVEISAPRTAPNPNATPGMSSEATQESIPARFNVNSTLTATVKSDGPNDFKFEVQSK